MDLSPLLDALAAALVRIAESHSVCVGCRSTQRFFIPFSTDFVNNNPGAFADAYFDFAALRVYQ